MGENALRLLTGAVVGILIARYLGPEGLGLLSFGASVFGLLIPVSTLGMRQILTRDFAVQDDWRPYLVASLSRQLPMAILASFVGAVIVVFARDFDPDATVLAIALLPLPVLSLGDTFRALLEAQGNVKRVAAVSLVAALLSSALKVIAIAMSLPVWVFGLLISVEAAAVAIGLFGDRLKKGVWGSIKHHYSRQVAAQLMRDSWPLLLAAIAVTLYMKIDIAMLGVLAGDEQAGIYVASARLSEVWYFIPVAAAAAVRPTLSRLYSNGHIDEYRSRTQLFITASFWFSVLAAVGTAATADTVVPFIYGSDYEASAAILKIHVLAAPFVYMGVASSQWFIDQGQTRAVMVRSSAAALVNVGLNLLLIPSLGPIGAAIATLVSYVCSGYLFNAFFRSTHEIFLIQTRSLRMVWGWRSG